MTDAQRMNDEQSTLWNGSAGRAWVESQDLLDRMFQPFEELLAESAKACTDGRILDVGCGAGGTTLAMARVQGVQGRCLGVDISEPLIAAARARQGQDTATVEFLCADAQICEFDPASFDRITSRFGVMFFQDPVSAFTNLRRAARTGAALQCIAWRGPEDNPFMIAAEGAAVSLLPDLPTRVAGAPGQFAFADREHVRRILIESAWANIDIHPIDVRCAFPESQLIPYLTRLGPLGRVLAELDVRTREQLITTARAAFEPYVQADTVRFNAACWMIEARSR